MGCFLSCFRGAGPDPASGDLRDPLVRGASWIGDAFLDDETKVGASGKLDGDLGNGGSVEEELMREANYLKSCGAIAEMPLEILQGSNEIIEEENYPKSCGAITETPPEILQGSNQLTEEANYLKSCGAIAETPPETPQGSNQITEEVIKGTVVSEENLSEGFNCDEHNALEHEQYADECSADLLEVESVPQSFLQDMSSHQNIRNQRLDSSDSPYPTPLVLRGDMQTPVTLNTAYKGTLRSGKRTRANKQFIYPVLRPIENKLQWMELRDDSSPVLSSNPPKRRYLSTYSSEKPQQTFTSSMAKWTEPITSASFSVHDIRQDQGVIYPEEPKSENDNRKLLDDVEQLKYNAESVRKGVASLSCWLKPPSSDGGSQSDTEGKVAKQRCYDNSVFTDVPIFTASGLYCDNDKPTPVLPKVWDGNGIPNTTTKYKEDQKVSWHATPFEERLMKVLSDEKPHHQRRISGKLIQLDEETNN